MIEPRTQPREEAIVTDGTNVPAPPLNGLFEERPAALALLVDADREPTAAAIE